MHSKGQLSLFREISFFNNSHHSVCLTLDPIVTEVGSIICWPYEATVQPSSHIAIQFKFQFRRKGVVSLFSLASLVGFWFNRCVICRVARGALEGIITITLHRRDGAHKVAISYSSRWSRGDYFDTPSRLWFGLS